MTTRGAWGDGSPPAEAIVAAALQLIDEQGLAAMTTRRLAAAMGIHQPTIYRRIADRDALLGLVADAIMTEAGRLDREALSPRDWLQQTASRLRAVWRRHPHASPLLHYGGPHPAITQFLDDVVAVMRRSGLEGMRLTASLQAYLGYVLGTVMLENRSEPASASAPTPVDVAAFPDLHHLQQLVAQAGKDLDLVFEAGLEIVLAGIAPPD